MSIKEVWDKISITLAVPFGIGFIVLAIFGQLCLDNIPYLICEAEK